MPEEVSMALPVEWVRGNERSGRGDDIPSRFKRFPVDGPTLFAHRAQHRGQEMVEWRVYAVQSEADSESRVADSTTVRAKEPPHPTCSRSSATDRTEDVEIEEAVPGNGPAVEQFMYRPACAVSGSKEMIMRDVRRLGKASDSSRSNSRVVHRWAAESFAQMLPLITSR